MHHIMGEHQGAGGWGFIEGGMGAITQAIAASGRRFGLETLTDAAVAEVLISNGRATGVRTVDGRVFEASIVISNADCKTLFQKLVAPTHLPAEFLADIARYRTFSTAFKINIACDAPPRYRSFDKAKAGFEYPTYVHLAPDIDYLERAYDDAKYGWYSQKPFITPVVPTIVDTTLAPPGKHVVNLFGGHAPYTLKNGDWAVERDKFVKNVLAVVDEFAPGFSSQIIDMQVLLAPDIERIGGLPQGHIFHGELSPDQLFFQRPAAHYSDYRTPVGALYQCGSSCHPGGGVSGIPGYTRRAKSSRTGRRFARWRDADPSPLVGEGRGPRSGKGEGCRGITRAPTYPHLPIASQWAPPSPTRGEGIGSRLELHLERHPVALRVGAARPFAVLDLDRVQPGKGVALVGAVDGVALGRDLVGDEARDAVRDVDRVPRRG